MLKRMVSSKTCGHWKIQNSTFIPSIPRLGIRVYEKQWAIGIFHVGNYVAFVAKYFWIKKYQDDEQHCVNRTLSDDTLEYNGIDTNDLIIWVIRIEFSGHSMALASKISRFWSIQCCIYRFIWLFVSFELVVTRRLAICRQPINMKPISLHNNGNA